MVFPADTAAAKCRSYSGEAEGRVNFNQNVKSVEMKQASGLFSSFLRLTLAML